MKKVSAIAIASVLLSAGTITVVGAQGNPEAQQCSTVYNAYYGCADIVDEFNGSSLDTSRWRVLDETYLSNDYGYIKDENVNVSNGSLNLSIVRNQTNLTTSDGVHRTWGSARVEQMDSTNQEFGYWEIRVKLPTAGSDTQGTWGGAWLNNTDGKGGEIDMAESFGSDTPESTEPKFTIDSKVSSSVHFTPESNGKSIKAWNTVGNDWQTYGALKTPEGITLYLNGVAYMQVPSSTPGYAESFGSGTSMYTIFSAQAGNKYWGKANGETADRQTISVDYFRYWNLQDTPSETPSESVPSEQPTETTAPDDGDSSTDQPVTEPTDAAPSLDPADLPPIAPAPVDPDTNMIIKPTEESSSESSDSTGAEDAVQQPTADPAQAADSSTGAPDYVILPAMNEDVKSTDESEVDTSVSLPDHHDKMPEAQAAAADQKSLASTGLSSWVIGGAAALLVAGLGLLYWSERYQPRHSRN